MLVDTILETFPTHSIRIPRLIVEEVRRHLTPEEFREFIGFVTTLTAIDEDFIVPFELGSPITFPLSTFNAVNRVEYRIVYDIIEEKVVVLFLMIGTRENFYERLLRRLRK